jgi:peptidoglycan/xylan/chitin deacetylase (PgdA/CDA1 family)
MKILVSFVCLLVLITGFCSVSWAAQANVFIYHRFDEPRYPSTNISADIFRQQLEFLKNSEIEVLAAEDIAKRLHNGEALPAHVVAITVDDAFSSFYEVAVPILLDYGFPATLFVNTDSVGSAGYMTWDQIREVASQGITIGHHTAAHSYLVEKEAGETQQQWRQRIWQDLTKAQDAFIAQLGTQPQLFAYPYGEYNSPVIDIIKEFGFLAAFAQQSGVIWSGSDPYVLPRFPMGGPFATYKGFLSKLAMKPLKVFAEQPIDPVIGENPPRLLLKLKNTAAAKRHINCFVQGENRCEVHALSGRDGWVEIQADKPLQGRRNKYTLTMQPDSGGWAWYSHLWINAKNSSSDSSNDETLILDN